MVQTESKVILREKRIGDAAHDYAWRCDPDLARYDGVEPMKLPREEFMLYYAWDLGNGGRLKRWFAIEDLEGNHIGNCMFYDVDLNKKQAKLGIMIGDRRYWGKGYGTDAVNALVNYLFDNTELDRIYLDTLEWNVRAHKCFRKCGFITSGRTRRRGHDFLVMELHRRWLRPGECGDSGQ